MFDEPITRRAFVGLGVGSLVLFACTDKGERIEADDPTLEGACEPVASEGTCTVTNADIEGPYYLPDSPKRSVLDTLGDEGVSLRLSGVVSDGACTPLAGAVVEIWHANPDGAYDNTASMNYRGWVETDEAGGYAFETLLPGRYLNGSQFRPSHIHVKVLREGTEVLTSQIYFQGDPHLDSDEWAEPSRTLCLEDEGEGVAAIFDIALA